MTWTLARRTHGMSASVIREILRVTQQPGILSMAGGLPNADLFPVAALRAATDRVLAQAPREALQYAPSEGHGPLREWVAQRHGVDPGQVLVTSGSQQGLDLVGKLLIDAGSAVAVESPTYLGALQAFTPFEPHFVTLAGDAQGPWASALADLTGGEGVTGVARPRRGEPGGANRGAQGDVRFAYLVPNFQNPTGRVLPEDRRVALLHAAAHAGLPLVEDDPYGELWYDEPPPPSLQARLPQQVIHLGSFSKVLAPGLRLGYLIAPPALMPKLLQLKQASDLHTSGFAQRIVHEVLSQGLLDQHLPVLRGRYRAQRDAMDAALLAHMPVGTRWRSPGGGMFFWLRLPPGLDAMALLPQAVEAGVAFVPGAAFHAHQPDPRTLRLSFVTLDEARIDAGVRILGQVVAQACAVA